MTIEKLEARATGEAQLRGRCHFKEQNPEEAILFWAGRLQRLGYEVRIEEIFPDLQVAGNWFFELRMEKLTGEDFHAA